MVATYSLTVLLGPDVTFSWLETGNGYVATWCQAWSLHELVPHR